MWWCGKGEGCWSLLVGLVGYIPVPDKRAQQHNSTTAQRPCAHTYQTDVSFVGGRGFINRERAANSKRSIHMPFYALISFCRFEAAVKTKTHSFIPSCFQQTKERNIQLARVVVGKKKNVMAFLSLFFFPFDLTCTFFQPGGGEIRHHFGCARDWWLVGW